VPGSPGTYIGELFIGACRNQVNLEDCPGQCVFEWDGALWIQIINTCGV
jgi:hypothetical protein